MILETCGAWAGDIFPGKVHGERGSVCWGKLGISAVAIAITHKDAVDGNGGMPDPYLRTMHRAGLLGELSALSKLLDFDPAEGFAIAQGVPLDQVENADEIRRHCGVKP